MNPTSTVLHVNRPLTDISVAYIQSQSNFIATRVFPEVPVNKQSDLFFKYKKGDFFRALAQLRAPATESAGAGYGLEQDNYFAHIFGLHKDIADQERENEDSPLNGDRDATEFLTQSMLITRETHFVEKYLKAGVWGSDFTPTTKWGAAGSDPIQDFEAKRREITGRTGMLAREMKFVASPSVDSILRNHPAIMDRIKYTTSETVTEQLLARLFGIGEYMVAEAVKNKAKEGATDDVGYIVDNDCGLLAYAAPRPSLKMPTGGYTFAWKAFGGSGKGGVRVSKFRMEHLRADRVETEMAYDMKLVAPDCGIFFNDLL